MTDPMRTDSFENSTITSPVKSPLAHVMLGRMMNDASPSMTIPLVVDASETNSVRHRPFAHFLPPEPQTGIEPAFSCLQDRCSSQRELLRHGVQFQPLFRAAELDYELNTRTGTKS